MLFVPNLSPPAQAPEMDLSPWQGRVPFELLGPPASPPIRDRPYVVTLAPYGFFWFQLCETDGSATEPTITPAEFETLVVTHGWRSLLQGRTRFVLERDVLPAFLASRRWFAERGSGSVTTHVGATIPLAASDIGPTLALVEAKGTQDGANYLLPLMIKWARFDPLRRGPNALAAGGPRPDERTPPHPT